MEKGIRFKLIWEDPDMVEIAISAWNGDFGGATNMYLSHGEMVEAAQTLEGFPLSGRDERQVALGCIGSDDQASAILKFYIKDVAGHAGLELNLSTGSYPNALQKVILRASVEAASVDTFVSELKKIEERMDSTAFLMINP